MSDLTMEHTKGNWKVGTVKSTVVSDEKIMNTNFPCPPNSRESDDKEIEYYGGYIICESIGNNQDAKLIAAAPDLLKACINARKDMLKSGIGFHNADQYNILNNAIKKATE